MIGSDFLKKGFLYSHAGKVSTEKFSYLLDRKSHIDKILAGIKREKIIETDFLDKEESVDELENQINDIEDENIFTNEYETKHISDLNEQKLKYFSNVKNPCTYIESKIKNRTRNNYKLKKNNNNENNENNEKKISNQTKAKEELKKLIHSSNKFNYYYHLLHHTDNSNYYSEDENNLIIFGPEVNATRYNPKLEYIYPKIIYSPSFKLMSGRYDQQFLSAIVRNKIEKNKNKKKEMEREQRMQKIKESVNSKMDTIYKFPTFYNEKNNEFVKNNEKIREMKELKRSESLVVDTPMIKEKILGDIEMEKQLQRGMLPEHHDVRIRTEKAFNSYLNKNYDKTLEQIGGNKSKSLLYDNNTINNEPSLINNKNNSNINNNNNSSLNNNDTIYTSNAIKNEFATLYNTNSNNNESNSNSYFNIQHKNNSINIGFINNNHLMKKMQNLNNNSKNINQSHFKKLNLFKNQQKSLYNTSQSNIFKNIKQLYSSKMNKTIGTNIYHKKDSNYIGKTNSHFYHSNSSLMNKNSTKLKSINFDKMLSRQYLDNLNYEEEPLHPQVNPKYNLVHPKCIMKVVYANKTYHKSIKKFEGLGEEVTFDADKLFYKYNDHFPTKSFYFNKMSGRSSSVDGCLPSYMVNLGNRNSCLDFNDKSYKLNYFSEGHLKEQRSSFNQHKSFNSKLNMNLLNLKDIKYLNNF
jgi:hypothetical protein